MLSRLMRALAPSALTLVACLAFAAPVSAQTLETIRDRGFLICGASGALPGFAAQGADGRWTGFDVDLCRAIAAAVFGDPNKLEFRPLRGEGRFAYLQTGAIDVMTRNGSWTARRDTGFGARFVGTAFFDGQAFMASQSLGFVSAYELRDVSVCIIDGGEELSRVRNFFFDNQAAYTEVLYEDVTDLAVAYRSGLCNVISAPARELQAIRRELPEPATHRILPERISKELLGPMVREGDDQWFNIVRWTIFTLIDAEEVGATSRNLDSLEGTRTASVRRLLGLEGNFGTSLGLSDSFMRNILRSVGNYAEIYDRNFGAQTGAALLRGQNALWSNGGLHYAPPIR